MPYEARDYVRILRKVSGRNIFSGKKRITAKAGTLGRIWEDAGDGWYTVNFSYTRAFPDLAGLDVNEADLAPCTDEEADSVRAQREEAAERACKAAAEAAKAEKVRMPEIEEFATIRLTVPLKGADVFDDKAIYQLPVGSEGTVVHIFGDGVAFEVEFLIFPDPARPDDFISVQINVEASQCESPWRLADENKDAEEVYGPARPRIALFRRNTESAPAQRCPGISCQKFYGGFWESPLARSD